MRDLACFDRINQLASFAQILFYNGKSESRKKYKRTKQTAVHSEWLNHFTDF